MFNIHQDHGHVIPAWAKDVHSKSKGVASLRSPEAASLLQLLQLAHRLIGDVESFGPSIEQMLETVQQGEMDLEMQVTVLQFALHCDIFFSTGLFLVNLLVCDVYDDYDAWMFHDVSPLRTPVGLMMAH